MFIFSSLCLGFIKSSMSVAFESSKYGVVFRRGFGYGSSLAGLLPLQFHSLLGLITVFSIIFLPKP